LPEVLWRFKLMAGLDVFLLISLYG
jgi:hypothetical protein